MKKVALLAMLVFATSAMAAITWDTTSYVAPITNPEGSGNDSYCTSLVSDGTNLYYYHGRTGNLYGSGTGLAGQWNALSSSSSLSDWSHGEMYGSAMAYVNVGNGKLATARLKNNGIDAQFPWDKDRMGVYDIATDSWSWLDTGPGTDGRLDLNGGFFAIGNKVYGNQHAGGSRTTWEVDITDGSFGKAGFSGLTGSDTGWFSRAVKHAVADNGLVYSVKNDWTDGQSDGDLFWSWNPADYAVDTDVAATQIGELPFQIGEGAALVALPAGFADMVGTEGGLFLLRGRGEVGGTPHEGRGPAADDYGIFDIESGTWMTGILPGLSGAGASAAFHDGKLYIKVGHNDVDGVNGANDLIYVGIPEPASLLLLGLAGLLIRRR